MRKIFSKIHLWLSIPFGVIMAIVSFSGAMLVFEKELTEYFNRDFYFVEQVTAEPIPVGKVARIVAQTLPDSVTVTGVTVFADPARAYQVSLSQPRRASVYVDQYNGEIKGRYERGAFFSTMFRLHRWLLDSMKPDGGIFWGKMIVGTSTLLFVIVLISGLIIWWPRTKKGLKNRLKIVTNKGGHRFWFDLHVAGGFYTLLLLLVMALTGLTWSFRWYNTGFYKVFGVEAPKPPQQSQGQPSAAGGIPQMNTAASVNGERKKGHPTTDGEGNAQRSEEQGEATQRRSERGESRGEGGRPHSKGVNFRNWQAVHDELQATCPDFKSISISDGAANVAYDRVGNQRASDKYTFTSDNGEITKVDYYADQAKSGKMRGWIYSVHVGSFGGLFTRILWFIGALMGAVLPITGYYLWIRKKVKKRNRR